MIIGITGGIASGKSSVSDYLIKKGYDVIDSDILAHEAYNKDCPIFKDIIKQFDCLDKNGEIDRGKLGKIVFSDKEEKKKLEAIIHPYVFNRIEEEKKKKQSGLVFVVMPLLFEVGYSDKVDMVWCVYVSEDVELERLMRRDGIDSEYAKKKITSQIPLSEKVNRSDYVIDNSYSLEETYKNVDNVLNIIKKLEK